MWKKYEACGNCGTTERPHKGKGYCNKCYRPAMQVREVEAWDPSRPDTLKRYPGGPRNAMREMKEDIQEFKLMQEAYLIELNKRLGRLKDWEQASDEPADGMGIEKQLERIAQYAGAKNCDFHGECDKIGKDFSPEQRKVLSELLRRIEVDRPWRGVDLSRVLEHRANKRIENAEHLEFRTLGGEEGDNVHDRVKWSSEPSSGCRSVSTSASFRESVPESAIPPSSEPCRV